MKLKFLFSLFALTFVFTSRAQISKSAVLLGGSIGYNKGKSKTWQQDLKIKTFIFSPVIGVAVKENLVVGARFDYLKQTQNSKYDASYSSKQDIDTKNYGGGFFLRRYVPVINRLYVFGEGTASYTALRETTTQTSMYNKSVAKTKGYTTGLSFTPGVSFEVSKKFQIEGGFNSLFNVSYLKTKTTYNYSNQPENQELFSAGISHDDNSMFYVGFRFVI
ncbi:MAG TPA: hypothetical protein VIM79_21000 [Niastella sp.]